MTSREIQKLLPPDENCTYGGDCPRYCTQWSLRACVASYEQGLECGLCPDSQSTFMRPGHCYSCVVKVEKDVDDYKWASKTKPGKKKKRR